jgi:hypothetical protein
LPDDADDKANRSLIPDVPKPLANVTGYWKVGEIISYLLIAISPLGAVISPWLPGFLSEKMVALAFGVLCVAGGLLVRFLTQTRPGTNAAVAVIKSKNVLSKDEQTGLAELLEKLDRRSRCWVGATVFLSIVLVVVVAWQPVRHWWRTELPKPLTFDEARYFRPDLDRELLEKAPFLGAIRRSLALEAKTGERYEIVIFETVPFGHPTPEFVLTLDSEASRFDLTGYAFRRRGDSFEPLRANL